MFSRVRDEDIVKIKDQLLDLDVIVKCLYVNIHIETRGVELVEPARRVGRRGLLLRGAPGGVPC